MIKLPLDLNNWHKNLPESVAKLYNAAFNSTSSSLLDKTIADLLTANYTLWRLEDEARRKDVPDSYIADIKRKIDKENQRRNDLIDTIDALVREDVVGNRQACSLQARDENLPMNSETPGSIFDRLIILTLRSYNLKKELARKDINKNHMQRCSNMLKEVGERSSDLLTCLKMLLEDIYRGRKKLKSYKQHKLYNDPSLNPALRKP